MVIYEAAVSFENLFIRADILVKDGKSISLYEVKSKSIDAGDVREPLFLTQKQDRVLSKWEPYVYDVAFQKYVLTKTLPGCLITAHLMLADKSKVCPTDGLNQKFRILKDPVDGSRIKIPTPLTAMDLSVKLLLPVKVDRTCEAVYGMPLHGASFEESVRMLAKHYAEDKKIKAVPSPACGDCEYHATDEERASGLKCGFRECWKQAFGWKDSQFNIPTILDIWNFKKKDNLMQEKRFFISQVAIGDIAPKTDKKPGLSQSERQWMQVEKEQKKDKSSWLDTDGLKREMGQWKFPLHFIDFETIMVAIPFHKGMHPYEGICFQFSHHTLDEKGQVKHQGQYLNFERGKFPNYDFVRALKKELEKDKGTIFRYAAHENTYLKFVLDQLAHDPANISDREELSDFIRSITKYEQDGSKVQGERCMVDLLEMVKRFYYSPWTGGSNSLKYVLPAVLNESAWLQKKYGVPVYGAANGIPSLNYHDQVWVKKDSAGAVLDPYKLLPKVFEDMTDRDFELLGAEDDELREGGAAMMAYARMQFSEMDDRERDKVKEALLRYCELDTLAMVMLYEGWREMLKQ